MLYVSVISKHIRGFCTITFLCLKLLQPVAVLEPVLQFGVGFTSATTVVTEGDGTIDIELTSSVSTGTVDMHYFRWYVDDISI